MHISNSSIKKQVSCFKKIIRTNNIEDSIDIICETENDSTKKKLGKKKLLKYIVNYAQNYILIAKKNTVIISVNIKN